MDAKRMRALSGIVGFTFGLPLICPTPLAAQGNCQIVIDAMNKVVTTPSHSYTTITGGGAGGKPHTLEKIYTGGASYLNIGGKWTQSPVTTQQVLKQEEQNRQNSKYTCKYLRDEPVNGEMAALYFTHAETSDVVSEGQIWISKSKGLPLRHEEDFTIGGTNKNHHSTRYEYGNIQPPVH